MPGEYKGTLKRVLVVVRVRSVTSERMPPIDEVRTVVRGVLARGTGDQSNWCVEDVDEVVESRF